MGAGFSTVAGRPNAYCPICNPMQYVSSIMTNAAVRTAHHKDVLDLYDDIADDTLPAVSFVKPSELVDGHPLSSKLDLFEAFLRNIVERSEAKQQLSGWKVIKNAMPNPDGSIVYIHIISPVVKDADYSIMNNIYAGVKDPAQQKSIFDLYRGAMKQALFVIQGPLVADLSK